MGLGLVLIYMGLLGFGTMVSPGIGLSGRMIEMLPSTFTDWMHAPAYAVLTWLLTSSLQQRGWPCRYALFVAAAGAMVFGLWMEVAQGSVPGRVADAGDVMLNAAGIGTAALLILRRALPADRTVGLSPVRSYPPVA